MGSGSCFLFASKTADLSVSDEEIQGYDTKIKLEGGVLGLPEYVMKKFPHIEHYKAFNVPSDLDTHHLFKCQLAVGIFNYAWCP